MRQERPSLHGRQGLQTFPELPNFLMTMIPNYIRYWGRVRDEDDKQRWCSAALGDVRHQQRTHYDADLARQSVAIVNLETEEGQGRAGNCFFFSKGRRE
jgi:hypothetical protein